MNLCYILHTKVQRMGWVYLLGVNGDNMMYKIGVTKSDNINNRIKKLQTGNGNEIRLIHSFQSIEPFKMEKVLHSKFALERESGEWFLLSKQQVDSFLDECERIEKNFKLLQNNPFFNKKKSNDWF